MLPGFSLCFSALQLMTDPSKAGTVGRIFVLTGFGASLDLLSFAGQVFVFSFWEAGSLQQLLLLTGKVTNLAGP